MAKKVTFEAVQKKVSDGIRKIKTALKTIPYAFQQGQGWSVIDEIQASGQFEHFLLKGEVEEHAVFNRFEVFVTKRAAVYHSYNGYWVSVTPFSKGLDGHAHDTTLYQWLVNLVATKKAAEGHEDDVFEDGYTYRDLLDADEIVTWANMMYPTVVFADVNKAYEQANEHMKWLMAQAEELDKAMSAPASEPDLRADIEAEAQQEATAMFMEMLPDGNES